MSESKPNHHILIGKWRVVSLFCNTTNKGWKCLKAYKYNSIHWEFLENNKLIEKKLKFPEEITEYRYFSDDKQLYIDRSDYTQEGYPLVFINDLYRIQEISETELWLYDMEDVFDEPEDYRIKFKIRRL